MFAKLHSVRKSHLAVPARSPVASLASTECRLGLMPYSRSAAKLPPGLRYHASQAICNLTWFLSKNRRTLSGRGLCTDIVTSTGKCKMCTSAVTKPDCQLDINVSYAHLQQLMEPQAFSEVGSRPSGIMVRCSLRNIYLCVFSVSA